MTQQEHGDFRELFTRQVRLGDSEAELDRAALYLAGEEYPSLEVGKYLDQLDRLAAQVRQDSQGKDDPASLIDGINQQLFLKQGFSGNSADYYSPENSFLNRVLETGQGIPITLSVIYLEVCRRLGIGARGVGLPGHFVISVEALDLYLDPFNAGQLLSAADCRRLVQNMFGVHFPWREEFLATYAKKDILFRMLANLKAIYLRNWDYPRAVAALERMALIDTSSWIYRDLAWCYYQTDNHQEAARYIDLFLEHAGDSSDAESERQRMLSLWKSISQQS